MRSEKEQQNRRQRTSSGRVDHPLSLLDPGLQLAVQLHRPESHSLIDNGSTPNTLHSNMVSRNVVPQHHVERGRRASFLPVALNVHPISAFASERQPGHITAIPVVIDDNPPVLGEKVTKVVIGESMWMRTEGSKDHEISDVHNPHAKLRGDLAEKGGCGDDFERDLRTDTNEDDIRAETFISGAEPPDAGTRSGVDLSLLRAEPNSRGMLRTNHQVNVVFRVDTMSDRAQEAVGIRREVDTSGVSLEIENSADERRVLMREPVVFLTSPGGGFEVVEGGIREPEVGLLGYLDELGVLDHHGLRDADKGFVRREKRRAPGQGIPLNHTYRPVSDWKGKQTEK